MQLQNEVNLSRYDRLSSIIRNTPKMLDTASTAFASTTRTASFRMRRTSSFTNSNVKNKLDIFECNLVDIARQIEEVRATTQQSKQYASKLTNDLTSHLNKQHKQLESKIKQMKQSMDKVKNQQRDRIQNIRAKCSQLCDTTCQIRSRFQDMRCRMEEMERIMGYYGGNEKFKS